MSWIALFLEVQAAENYASVNTLAAYRRDLEDFESWLAPRPENLEDIDRAGVEAYLIACDARGLAASTRARRLAAIRGLFRFAFEEGMRADNPAIQISGPSRAKSIPKSLSHDAVEAILKIANGFGRTDADRLRNKAMVEILYATGMRVSELVSLPAASVRGDPRMILVVGKGGKERMVPLSEPARAAIKDWLGLRDEDKALKLSSFLFPSRGKAGHITRIRFYQLLKDMAVRAGVPPADVTPHRLRHAFATHLLAGGADLRAIQMLLGHADVSTTEIYTHVLDERLKSLVLESHPLAQAKD